MSRPIQFTKMHGAGNDYIYVYTPTNPVANPSEASIAWSRPHFGIGADGLILIGRSERPEADFTMRIFNNDGSEAMMCGNGVRCVGKYVYDHRLTDKTTVRIDTLSGVKVINLHLEAGQVTSATVDMGYIEPMAHDTISQVFVSVGNPHYVIFVPDAEAVDLRGEGARLEHEAVPGQRCKIEFATVRPDGSIRMRVWERGSGITLACGTGACATLVAACSLGLTGRQADVEMDGGTLHIEWAQDGHVLMTGPAATAFEGTIHW